MTQSHNRRSHNRLPISALAIVTVKSTSDPANPRRVRGVARDISLGGVRIEVSRVGVREAMSFIRDGSEVMLHLDLAGGKEPLFFEGIVVWIHHQPETPRQPEDYQFGVKFEEVDPAAVELIEDLYSDLRRSSTDSNPVLKGKRLT